MLEEKELQELIEDAFIYIEELTSKSASSNNLLRNGLKIDLINFLDLSKKLSSDKQNFSVTLENFFKVIQNIIKTTKILETKLNNFNAFDELKIALENIFIDQSLASRLDNELIALVNTKKISNNLRLEITDSIRQVSSYLIGLAVFDKATFGTLLNTYYSLLELKINNETADKLKSSILFFAKNFKIPYVKLGPAFDLETIQQDLDEISELISSHDNKHGRISPCPGSP